MQVTELVSQERALLQAGASNFSSFPQRSMASYFECLPNEIVCMILEKLELETLLRAATVCSKWRQIIHGTNSFFFFVKAVELLLNF
jgi:hypothetical protein